MELPVANPVAGLPPGSTATAEASATIEAARRVIVLEGAALEAGGAAGEVMGATVADGAVPVAGPHVRAGGEAKGGGPAADSWLVAAVTRVSPLEVEVLAGPAIPISRPAHLNNFPAQ